MQLPKPPARPVPNRSAADFGLDLGLAHPGIVIPGAVVSADVRKAEPAVAVELETRFGRAKITAGIAPRVVTKTHRRVGLGLENGMDHLAPHRAQYGWPAGA